jgi:uncharacterized protein (DUF1330 family)
MPAYLIVTCVIHDRAAFLSGYAPEAARLTQAFGGRYVLRAPGGVWMEAGFGGSPSVVISEWPDRAAAERFWNSPEYAAAKALRDGVGEAQVLLIETQTPIG